MRSTSQLDSLRAELERVRQTFRVPGMAVVAIQDGRVVFREGFGYRHVEAQKPFTPDTICLVASTTKSFTAGLTGILVEEGTVDWTKPVREYWPEFKMVDDFATREIISNGKKRSRGHAGRPGCLPCRPALE